MVYKAGHLFFSKRRACCSQKSRELADVEKNPHGDNRESSNVSRESTPRVNESLYFLESTLRYSRLTTHVSRLTAHHSRLTIRSLQIRENIFFKDEPYVKIL